jgi:hypothetical protein
MKGSGLNLKAGFPTTLTLSSWGSFRYLLVNLLKSRRGSNSQVSQCFRGIRLTSKVYPGLHLKPTYANDGRFPHKLSPPNLKLSGSGLLLDLSDKLLQSGKVQNAYVSMFINLKTLMVIVHVNLHTRSRLFAACMLSTSAKLLQTYRYPGSKSTQVPPTHSVSQLLPSHVYL